MTKKTKKLTIEERSKKASNEIEVILKKYNLGLQAITRPQVQLVDMLQEGETVNVE